LPALASDAVTVDRPAVADSGRTNPRSRNRIPGSAAGHAVVSRRATIRRPRAGPVSIRIGADDPKRPARGRSRSVATASIPVPGGAAAAGRSSAARRSEPIKAAPMTSAAATAAARRPKLHLAAPAASPAATPMAAAPAGASPSPTTTHPIRRCGRRLLASARTACVTTSARAPHAGIPRQEGPRTAACRRLAIQTVAHAGFTAKSTPSAPAGASRRCRRPPAARRSSGSLRAAGGTG
jgi:hypothetical protein